MENTNQIRRIAEQFNRAGYELFEVGGHVRDSILGRESSDIDLTTNAIPEQTRQILEQFCQEIPASIYTVGVAYGTIGLAFESGLKVEVTTYRKEVYPTDSRKPNVTFGEDLQEDLARRDFTINAIARNPLTEEVIDPFNGRGDITRRVIRCVGSNDRFNEDPLRMMRAVRFACQLSFGLKIQINNPERLSIISEERIREELDKILLSPKPVYGIQKLVDFGLMKYIIPEFLELRHVAQGKNHIKDAYLHSLMVLDKGSKCDHNQDNLVFRLACLLHDIGKPTTKTEDASGVHFYSHHDVGADIAQHILERLKFETDITARVCTLISLHMTPLMLQNQLGNHRINWKRSMIRLVRKTGEGDIWMLLDLVKCDIRSSKNPRHDFLIFLHQMVEEALKEQPAKICSPLDGKEIMAEFNLPAGKQIGAIKEYLTNLVIDAQLGKDDKDEARRRISEWLMRPSSSDSNKSSPQTTLTDI